MIQPARRDRSAALAFVPALAPLAPASAAFAQGRSDVPAAQLRPFVATCCVVAPEQVGDGIIVGTTHDETSKYRGAGRRTAAGLVVESTGARVIDIEFDARDWRGQ
jgi:hypothetical protein